MIDFLLSYYSFITHAVEFLAALTGIFYYKKYKNSVTKYFIFFLLFVAVCDSICFYTHYVRPNEALSFLIGTKFQKNHWFSTLYWDVGAIVFFTFYFYRILEKQIFKNIIKYSGYFFFLFSLVYIGLHWEQFFYEFFKVLDVIGAIIIFLCSVFYFIEILESDKILEFYKSINFYISATIFIWWLVITPFTFYDVYFTYEIGNPYRDYNFRYLRRQSYLFANILMYSTFTFALIWCTPNNDLAK